MSDEPVQNGMVGHYTRLEHLANVLVDKRLRFGAVGDLQDPRESSMGWIETIGIGLESDVRSENQAKKIIQCAGKQIRVLCTAGERQELKRNSPVEEALYGRPRMWSQYGDSSKGFCVVLDRKILGDELTGIAKTPDFAMDGPVSYHPWLEFVASNIELETGSQIKLNTDESFPCLNKNGMMRSIYFKKSEDWMSESEYRFLLFSLDKEPTYISIANAVRYVVLGTRFPVNQINEVRGCCQELKCDLYALRYDHPQYIVSRI